MRWLGVGYEGFLCLVVQCSSLPSAAQPLRASKLLLGGGRGRISPFTNPRWDRFLSLSLVTAKNESAAIPPVPEKDSLLLLLLLFGRIGKLRSGLTSLPPACQLTPYGAFLWEDRWFNKYGVGTIGSKRQKREKKLISHFFIENFLFFCATQRTG